MERDYSAIEPQEVFKTLLAKKSRCRAPAKDERDLHTTLAGFLLYSRRNISEQQFLRYCSYQASFVNYLFLLAIYIKLDSTDRFFFENVNLADKLAPIMGFFCELYVNSAANIPMN